MCPVDRVVDFLNRYFGAELPPEADIFALGLVNSLFAMELVVFIEKEFGLTVADEDLELDNFRSARAMADLIERKRAGAPS
ncbi:acyl carrier protein [Plantactinospora sp. DSM 117369]